MTADTSLRLAGVIRESVVDGPGWRMVVFAQGCEHHCPGCQNPQTHDPMGGYLSSVSKILAEARKNPLLEGITLSGGEPFMQARAFAALASGAHGQGLDVVTFTGWSFEELYAGANSENGWLKLLEATDWLIDGRFVLAERTLELKFRGSRNQRVIDPAASLRLGSAVERDI